MRGRNPIQTIVEHFNGQNEMARTLGCAQSTVWYWVQQGHVPHKRVAQIIKAARRLNPPVRLEHSDFFPPSRDAQ